MTRSGLFLFLLFSGMIASTCWAQEQDYDSSSPDDAQRAAMAKQCFERAKVSVQNIKGTNCYFTSSYTGATAVYQCKEHLTEVNGCNSTKKPTLAYLAKVTVDDEAPQNRMKRRNWESFKKCYKKIKTGLLDFGHTDNFYGCEFRVSFTEQEVYADCPKFKVEINHCDKDKPEMKKTTVEAVSGLEKKASTSGVTRDSVAIELHNSSVQESAQ